MLDLQALQPGPLVRPGQRLAGLLGKGKVVSGVALVGHGRLTAGLQLLESKGPDGFQLAEGDISPRLRLRASNGTVVASSAGLAPVNASSPIGPPRSLAATGSSTWSRCTSTSALSSVEQLRGLRRRHVGIACSGVGRDGAHVRDRGQCAVAGKDRQPPENSLRVLGQQAVAPCDDISHRALAGGQVAGALAQHAERGAHAGQETTRRQHRHPGGG